MFLEDTTNALIRPMIHISLSLQMWAILIQLVIFLPHAYSKQYQH